MREREEKVELDREIVRGVCIDHAGAFIRDDAVWAEEINGDYRVSMSIADVATLVPPHSSLDNLAQERGFTRYGTNGTGTRHMLPEEVIRAASLTRREHNTITVAVTLDGATFDIKETRVMPSFLKNERGLSFERVDQITADGEDPQSERFREWGFLAERLRAHRRNGAAIILDRFNEVRKFDWPSPEETYAKWLSYASRSISRRIVSEFVTLGGNALALWCRERGLPVLYRNHTASISATERTMVLGDIDRAYAGDLSPAEFEALEMRVAAIYGWAFYSPSPMGHGVINMLYIHYSSPMRRYADLLVQQALHSKFRGDRHVRTDRELILISQYINAMRREAFIGQYPKVHNRLKQGSAHRSSLSFIVGLGATAALPPRFDEEEAVDHEPPEPESEAEKALDTYTRAQGLCPPRYSVSRSQYDPRQFRCRVCTNVPFDSTEINAIAYAASASESRSRAASTLLTKLVLNLSKP